MPAASKIAPATRIKADKVVFETALDQEMTEHLGHEKNTPAGNEAGNVRNGARPKTVLTEGTA